MKYSSRFTNDIWKKETWKNHQYILLCKGKSSPKFWPGVSMYCIVHRVAKCRKWWSDFHFLSFSNDKLYGTFSHILFYYPSVFFSEVSIQIFCTFLEFELSPFSELNKAGKIKYNKSRKEGIVIDPLQRQKGLPSKICLEC